MTPNRKFDLFTNEDSTKQEFRSMYVCPQCKGPLFEFTCNNCGRRYPVIEDIPYFLKGSPEDTPDRVAEIYDQIYQHNKDVWIDQGRSEGFQKWFSELAASFSVGPLLEVGCGEGLLLAAFHSETRIGIDPSIRALLRARERSTAICAAARAEELPFPPESFDIVTSVGVMEHFENPDAATAEIKRVLTRSGHYIALMHTDMTLTERLRVKLGEFLFPQPRPIAFLTWFRKKLVHPIVQPLRKSYTIQSASVLLERSGLRVKQIITRDACPSAPLAGRHVVILVAEKLAP